jgi:hypothetical protein
METAELAPLDRAVVELAKADRDEDKQGSARRSPPLRSRGSRWTNANRR